MKLKTVPIFLLCALATACQRPLTSEVPTPFPADYLPTIVAQTGEAAFATARALTPSPTLPHAGSPTAEAASPTPPPTLTETPEPAFGQFAEIRFLAPGPASKAVSPIHLQLLLQPGDAGTARIELLGEDGRVLFRQIARVPTDTGPVYRSFEVPFEIRAVAETALLQVSTADEFGRAQALNSLPLLLLSTGQNQLNPPGNIIYERVALESPMPESMDADGVVDVEGRIWPFNDDPVFLELILPQGQVIGARVLDLRGIELQSFATTVPYKLPPGSGDDAAVPARLSIRQMDPDLQIPLFVATRLVNLVPAP